MLVFNTDFHEDYGYILEALEDGRLTEQRLDEAVTRILALKAKYCHKVENEPVPAAAWHEEAADKAITLVKNKQPDKLPMTPDRYPNIRLVTLGKDDTYTTQENLGMPEITVQRMKTVEILYGGKTLQISCYAETVADLLQQLDIVLTENDVISEAQTATVYDGMVLTVSRTITQEETYTTSIPFITEYCYDASLKEGEQVVLTEGVEAYTELVRKRRYEPKIIYRGGRKRREDPYPQGIREMRHRR